MLNYNGSSVEQYITLALISNELIVRNVITANTTGIRKALGITTLIMPNLSVATQAFTSSPLLLLWDQLSPTLLNITCSEFLEESISKRPTILYKEIQQQAKKATQWHTNCLTDIPNLPGCIVSSTNILETRGNGKETEVRNFIWKNCRACYEPM